jgi:hypothetical protein
LLGLFSKEDYMSSNRQVATAKVQMKHIVHCSGYSLAEDEHYTQVVTRRGVALKAKYYDWDHVCIGIPATGLLGRIPMTIKIAQLYSADCIIWSTGATFANGKSEAEIMCRCALHHAGFETSAWLSSISLKEEVSTNTMSALVQAANIIEERFPSEEVLIYFVTSANHAPRVVRDATIAFAGMPRATLAVIPAHTSYGHREPSSVTIKELG